MPLIIINTKPRKSLLLLKVLVLLMYRGILSFLQRIIALLLGVPLIALELYLLFKLDSGNRLGDVMADTTVMASDGNQVVIREGKTSWFDAEAVEKA